MYRMNLVLMIIVVATIIIVVCLVLRRTTLKEGFTPYINFDLHDRPYASHSPNYICQLWKNSKNGRIEVR
jgi:hypothetical protein